MKMVRGALTAALMLATLPAAAQMSDYERGKVEQAFAAKALQIDPETFDGERWGAGIDERAASRAYSDYVRAARSAISAANGLSGAARGTEEGRAYVERAREIAATQKAMRAAIDLIGEGSGAAEAAPADDLSGTEAARQAAILDGMMASGLYDGTAFDAGATTAEAEAFTDAFFAATNAAIKALNAMPGDQRRTEAGKALTATIRERSQQARAMNQALAAHREANADMDGMMAELDADAGIEEATAALRALLDDPVAEGAEGTTQAQLEAQAKEIATATATLGDLIRSPDASATVRDAGNAVWNEGKRYRNRYGQVRSTLMRREMKAAAEKRQRQAVLAREAQAAERARALAEEATRREAERLADLESEDWSNPYIPHPEKLVLDDGFFSFPWGSPSWEALVEKGKAEVAREALGASQLAAALAAIEENADTWDPVPRVEPGDAEYMIDMVRKGYEENDGGLVDLWISRSNWKIARNDLGVILSRSKPGYALYREPGGKGCILRQWWFKEAYTGAATYEPATSWRMASLRFQPCDRR